jgi:hypothetical protein
MSLGPGLYQATKSHLKKLHNWLFKNVAELTMFTNPFFSLIQTSCTTAAALVVNHAAVLLAIFDVFVCLWIGQWSFSNSTSNRQWQFLRVQAPGCLHKTIPKLQVCFSWQHAHRERDRHRQRPRDTESFPTYLCNKLGHAENWIQFCCVPSSTGFQQHPWVAPGCWVCWLNSDAFLVGGWFQHSWRS